MIVGHVFGPMMVVCLAGLNMLISRNTIEKMMVETAKMMSRLITMSPISTQSEACSKPPIDSKSVQC